jgi:hypothetical protein
MTAFSLNFNLPDGATIEIGDWGIPDYDSEKAAEGKDMIHEWQRAGKALDEAIERAKLVVAHKDAVRKHKKACADVENARYALTMPALMSRKRGRSYKSGAGNMMSSRPLVFVTGIFTGELIVCAGLFMTKLFGWW